MTIDLTPTWSGLMPAFFNVLEGGDAEGKAMAKEQLMGLALAVDRSNAKAKEEVEGERPFVMPKTTTETKP